jgi:hypothetical protein
VAGTLYRSGSPSARDSEYEHARRWRSAASVTCPGFSAANRADMIYLLQ